MATTPPYDELLSLIDERSAALRDAVVSAPGLDERVPGCPEWSLRELVEHVGRVQRSWAANIAAGPREAPPTSEMVGDTTPGADLPAWSAESTDLLLTALRAASEGQECWTWWGASEAPSTAGAVARHQVQEAAVHAYDAQEAAGNPEPLPTAAAVDGVAEFLTVVLGSSGVWPHRPAHIGWQAAEGPYWLLDLTSSGASLAEDRDEPPTATVHGRASDLVLALHRRVPAHRVRIQGEPTVVEELFAWPSLD